MRLALPLLLLALLAPSPAAADGNRLTYLDGADPYYVGRNFPKLTTPQWAGEDGVEAVVILAIDDMREPKKYEDFLRPVLNRLKKIDGRAPVSIMTNRVDPKDPLLQTWLREGLSIECHTLDHPCPFFKSGSFVAAKQTYDGCIDLMASIPNSRPVAFRMPCCDSLNTPSPRHFAEIFNKTTDKGNFLTIDSSVFHYFTANDPELPRDLVLDPTTGEERFRKYLPMDRSFVNTVEDYPYPYVIGRLCWQFPCMTPSDWEAQHLHKPNNPITVRDWKAALDATVVKQGVFTMVFHPHGWIRAEQVVDLIDHAVSTHGKKVKFLTFREAQERLDRHLLAGQPIRDPKTGADNGVRLVDLDGDGYLDVVVGNDAIRRTRVWDPDTKTWRDSGFPAAVAGAPARFGFLHSRRHPTLLIDGRAYDWDSTGKWAADSRFDLKGEVAAPAEAGSRLVDLDGDGQSELLAGTAAYRWSPAQQTWALLPFDLPRAGDNPVTATDPALRLIDLDGDGRLDVVFSNEKESGVYLWQDMKSGWSRKVIAGKQGDKGSLPMIANKGMDNGCWAHSRYLWWSNEGTPLLKDHVARVSYNELLADVMPGPKSPEAGVKSIQVRPGFQVELVAAEPLVQDPVAFAWGPDGKFWVVEMGDYPLGTDGKGRHGGTVKFLEDTDGDGKYDKSTQFLENLGYPTGVMPWGKGVLVTCAPDVFYAEDTDNDGKADLKKVLYTGFKEGNQQHRVNGPVWGLDNWVHLANGDSGGDVKSVKTGESVGTSGRDVRIRPWTGEIEATTGQTQFGRHRDDWGNWFGNNNSHPLFHFALDDHYLRRNPNYAPPSPKVEVPAVPGSAPVYPVSPTLPRFNNPQSVDHFTSACGTIIYRDDLFGPAFAGNMFVSEPVHNLVHREIVSPSGSTFTSRRAQDELQSEFLASSDNWFRPTMLGVGPDGALYVADMYRLVIEHPQWIPLDWQRKLDLRAGHEKGRIYRVSPVGSPRRPVPRLDRMTTAKLVAALDSPGGWQRDAAQMLLVQKKDSTAVPLLAGLVRSHARPLARLHALCTLDGLGALTPEILRAALGDEHPGVRRHAVRLCEPFLAGSPGLGEELLKLQADTDPQVRIQLAYSLGEWPDAKAGRALGKLALSAGGDRFLLAAVMSSVGKGNLDGVLLAALQGDTPSSPALTADLIRLAQRQGNTAALATLLERVGDTAAGAAPWQLAALGGLLDSLEQGGSSLTALGRSRDDRLRAAVAGLSALFARAREIAADSAAPPESRRAAVRLLGRQSGHQADDVRRLAGLLTPRTPVDVQQAAAASLGRLPGPEVPPLLLKNWAGYTPAVRGEVLDALLAGPDGTAALLDALEKQAVEPSGIDAARRQRLLTHKSAPVRERAAGLLAATAETDRSALVARYRGALAPDGDAARGKLVFAKTCTACHHLDGAGEKLAPDLSALAGKTTDWMLQAILDPNQAVEARYLGYTAVTRDGRSLAGLLVSETATSITLAGPDGKQQTILRADIDELFGSGKSVMPEGLEKDIDPGQMADLLAYLKASQSGSGRKTFPGNTPETVRPGKGGEIVLKSGAAEIYGPSIVLEPKYGNIGFWHSPDDRVLWSADVPRAGEYQVVFDWACDNGSAGNVFALECRGEKLTGKVQGTGSWDDYRQAAVGRLRLPSGRCEITLQPAGPVHGALIDLRSVTLRPVGPE